MESSLYQMIPALVIFIGISYGALIFLMLIWWHGKRPVHQNFSVAKESLTQQLNKINAEVAYNQFFLVITPILFMTMIVNEVWYLQENLNIHHRLLVLVITVGMTSFFLANELAKLVIKRRELTAQIAGLENTNLKLLEQMRRVDDLSCMEMIRNANNLLQVISNTNDYLLNSFELVTREEVKDNLHRIKIHVDQATELLKSIDFKK